MPNRSSLPPTDATVGEVQQWLTDGHCSARQLIDGYLDYLQRVGRELNAVVEIFVDEAHLAADESDQRRSSGQSLGPLDGIPFTAKMNITTQLGSSDASSPMLRGFKAKEDATAVGRLRAAGAVLVGKTSCDEFAMGASNETSCHGVVSNPWNRDRVPGGSSGGSAALAGSHGWSFHLGSDTGGSIRQPAAFCNATAIKPTWGRVSRRGLIAFGSSLDQICPIARDAVDCQTVLQVMEGYDPLDSTSLKLTPSPLVPATLEPIRRVALITDGLGAGIDASIATAVRAAAQKMANQGIEIIERSLPHLEAANACYQVISTAEASSNLARYDGVHVGVRAESDQLQELYETSRHAGFGSEVRRRILLGTFVLSAGYRDAYYTRALAVRDLIRQGIDQVLEDCDALLLPVSPFAPFRIGERIDDPLALYACDILTVTANLAGVPALALPCDFDEDQLPIGMQLMGAHGSDHRLLEFGQRWQRWNDLHRALPEGSAR
ncbi:MAG: amidase family protein [Planctomycetota bacterium]|nr:amidase family protein [Planctomycetota bacterium]